MPFKKALVVAYADSCPTVRRAESEAVVDTMALLLTLRVQETEEESVSYWAQFFTNRRFYQVLTKGEKMRRGCITPAFLETQRWAKLLRTPALWGVP